MAKPVTDSNVTASTRLPTAVYNRIGVANNDRSPRPKARRPQHSGGRTWDQDSKQRRCAAAVGYRLTRFKFARPGQQLRRRRGRSPRPSLQQCCIYGLLTVTVNLKGPPDPPLNDSNTIARQARRELKPACEARGCRRRRRRRGTAAGPGLRVYGVVTQRRRLAEQPQ